MKYEPLGNFLRAQRPNTVELSISDIERLVGPLPKSAFAPQFWANAGGYHLQRRSNWLGVGYSAFYRPATNSVLFEFAPIEPVAAIEAPMREGWSLDELRTCVVAYSHLLDAQQRGEQLNKAALRRSVLPSLRGRSEASYEFRMRNISAVMEELGLPTVSGYLPAKNLGGAKQDVVELIAELFGNDFDLAQPTADPEEFEARVLAERVLRTETRVAFPPQGQREVRRRQVTIDQFVRDPKVVAWVLDEARGVCEICYDPAPFQTRNGEPYLEVHHVRPLSDGGPDVIQNAVACCPNCHRRMHHAHDSSDATRELVERVERLQAFPVRRS